jgi:hypothetical protein
MGLVVTDVCAIMVKKTGKKKAAVLTAAFST